MRISFESVFELNWFHSFGIEFGSPDLFYFAALKSYSNFLDLFGISR